MTVSNNTNQMQNVESLFDAAKMELLSSNKLSHQPFSDVVMASFQTNFPIKYDEFTKLEQILLRNVSLKIHHSDNMYESPDAKHYLNVGLSAMRCIETALISQNKTNSVNAIMDFPCGYGRILRFLRARFPKADITISELETAAVDFCKLEFSTDSLEANTDLSKLPTNKQYDLIWCGSLVTHLDQHNATELLRYFYSILAPDGLCIFSSHGSVVAQWIEEKRFSYGLTESAQQKLLAMFNDKGYGYADYGHLDGYGISVVSHRCMSAIARSVGLANEVMFIEQGWGNHHDVYCFSK